jgi:hypothetical protein
MPATPPPSLDALAKYPKMTAWFNPKLLAKLLWRVIVSDLFGQYADRRLIVAALDTVSSKELVKRAKQFAPGEDNEETWTLRPDTDGAIWIDFVADLGDGFDATYAIASLLSQERLVVNGHVLPRGQVLVMGGDEVYPTASQETYQRQLRDPYGWAFLDPHPGLLKGPPIYAIPGNHDWYDGLVTFLALFSRKEHLHLGGWRSHQRRSYFALQLTPNWWVWAMDAQLAHDVDQPQKDYFAAIAKGMSDNANIILCGPEPGWLYTLKQGSKSFRVIDYVGWIALNEQRGLKIPLVLSGDTHNYSRYVGDDNHTQFITSGGGGAFLHPTHHLESNINVDRASEGVSWLDGRVKQLTLGRAGDPNAANGPVQKEALYPSRKESLALLTGNFRFVAYNSEFAILLGALYWLLGLIAISFPWDASYLAPIILFVGFWSYTKKQEGGGAKVFFVSAGNALLHSLAVIFIALFFSQANEIYLGRTWPRFSFLLFAAEMIVVGGVIAAALFGGYLYASSRWWNLNHNDAFSSMRLDSHRNFLRIRIKDDELTIYPIGLDRVPRRHEWRFNTDRTGTPPPVYVPVSPLTPHLIETPIAVRSWEGSQGPHAAASA